MALLGCAPAVAAAFGFNRNMEAYLRYVSRPAADVWSWPRLPTQRRCLKKRQAGAKLARPFGMLPCEEGTEEHPCRDSCRRLKASEQKQLAQPDDTDQARAGSGSIPFLASLVVANRVCRAGWPQDVNLVQLRRARASTRVSHLFLCWLFH